MNDVERQEMLELAFLEDGWTFCGSELRPVTLGSLNVCHRIGCPILGKDVATEFAGLDRVEQSRRFLKFLWVHEEKLSIRQMLNAARNGEHVAMFAEVQPAPILCPLFNAWLSRFNCMVAASSFEIVERSETSAADDPPDTVIDPAWLVKFLDPIAARYHWPEGFLLWELPFVRALQWRHRAIQASPFVWTVKDAPPAESVASALAEAVKAVAVGEVNDGDV